jgi:Tfp pilus assembly protein PilN
VLARINRFLDAWVLPWPVRYLTNRFVILMTIALLIPLIAFAYAQVFVLSVNSYLNTMSVAVSSIVLLYATIAELRQKQIAEMQEKRAQEDHAHVVEMHQLVLDNIRYQHEEIEDLKEVLSALQGQTHKRKPLPDRVDLRSLHPGGPGRLEPGHVERVTRNLPSSPTGR